MKKEDLRLTKIYLSNVEDRVKFQKKMFSLGIKWGNSTESISYLDCPFYAVGSNMYLLRGKKEDSSYFAHSAYRQIYLHNVLAIEEPKDVCEFSPFDRVLVRDNNGARWKPKLFAFHNVDYDKDYPFETTDGGFFRYCISYNEDLANTTKNVK